MIYIESAVSVGEEKVNYSHYSLGQVAELVDALLGEGRIETLSS